MSVEAEFEACISVKAQAGLRALMTGAGNGLGLRLIIRVWH